jgi:hypothetical protein
VGVTFAIYRHLLPSIGKDLSRTITVYRKSMVVKMPPRASAHFSRDDRALNPRGVRGAASADYVWSNDR